MPRQNHQPLGRPRKRILEAGPGRGNKKSSIPQPDIALPCSGSNSIDTCIDSVIPEDIIHDDIFYDCDDFATDFDYGQNIILSTSSLGEFLEDNFCSKEYVSHGIFKDARPICCTVQRTNIGRL